MKIINQGLIKCACGCGKELERFGRYGERRYIHGHNLDNQKIFLDKSELEELYINQKLNTLEIAGILRVPQDAIYRWMKKYGIQTRSVTEALSKRRPKEELERLYITQGLSTPAIARKLGISQSTIHRWLQEYEIKTRKCSSFSKRRPKEELEEWYTNQKLSTIVIAKQLGVSSSVILKWLKEYGIKIRTKVIRKIKPKNELIQCACGCDEEFLKYDKFWRERRYLPGHQPSAVKKMFLSKEELDSLYTHQKLTIPTIAKRLGLHIGTIYGWLHKYGIEIIPSSELKRPKNELIACACGCGQKRWKYDQKGRERLYIYSHINKKPELRKEYIVWNKNKTFEEMYGPEKAKVKRAERIRYRAKQVTPKRDTKIEVKIQMFLKELGYEYFTHQYMKNIKHGYQCDILIPALNLVIECDGDYWHKYPIGTDLDHIRTKELLEKGFKVLRLWECEIKMMDIGKFKEDIDIIKMEVIK